MTTSDVQPIDALLDHARGTCECGHPPDGYAIVGRELWMTHFECKTRWLAIPASIWSRLDEEALLAAVPDLTGFREIPGQWPEWVREAFQRLFNSILEADTA